MPEVKPFYCLKCGSLVELLYFPGMPRKAEDFFNEMYEVRLCKKCIVKPVKFDKLFLN